MERTFPDAGTMSDVDAGDEYDFSGLPERPPPLADRPLAGAGRVVALFVLPLFGLLLLVAGALITASVPQAQVAEVDPVLAAIGGSATPEPRSGVDIFLEALGEGVAIAGAATIAVGLGVLLWLVVRPGTPR